MLKTMNQSDYFVITNNKIKVVIDKSMESNQENEIVSLPDMSDFVGLKKKKKKVKFNLNEFADHSESSSVGTDTPLSTVNNNENNEVAVLQEEDLSFDLPKKKKKKKTNVHDMTFAEEIQEKPVISSSSESTDLWTNDSAEYLYEDLLNRVYGIMREKDPNRDLECKKRLVMKPPQVIRVGTKKSSFINFLDICKMLHRNPQHLQAFLLVELGTSGSIDGNNQLIIKGRFEQRQIETVLRHYIKEYVTCHTCRSPDTYLQKDTRLFFLQCESCGSRCSVATIKSGFQAVTSKRAAIRAKAN